MAAQLFPLPLEMVRRKGRLVPILILVALVSITCQHRVVQRISTSPHEEQQLDYPHEEHHEREKRAREPSLRDAKYAAPTYAPIHHVNRTTSTGEVGGSIRSSSAPNAASAALPSTSWKDDLSRGIPLAERQRTIISFGICCSKAAQRDTAAREVPSHDHADKPYDVALPLAAALWTSQAPRVSIFATLGYIRGERGSEATVRAVRSRLRRLNATGSIIARPYDTSRFPDPRSACVRAGQIGRYYAHESPHVHANDFVMTTDSDVFPINATALLPFLADTNPAGDYYRVFLRGWGFSLGGARSLPLFGLGMSGYDWQRSLALSRTPTLREAILRVTGYSWGFDQTLATNAVMNGQLCYFPGEYRILDASLRVISHDRSTASEERDQYTCLKGYEDLDYGHMHRCCYDSYDKSQGCYYAHFTPQATERQFRHVYDAIAAETLPVPGQRAHTASAILGREEVIENRNVPRNTSDLDLLRRALRPTFSYVGTQECYTSQKKRSCDAHRKTSLPFVSGDFFRCLADIVFDETNNFTPTEEDVACLNFYQTQIVQQSSNTDHPIYPFIVFVNTIFLCDPATITKMGKTSIQCMGDPAAMAKIDAVIPGKYLLISHNHDLSVRSQGTAAILQSTKLVHWFGQNLEGGLGALGGRNRVGENRTTTIPIGLENNHWDRMFPELYQRTWASHIQKKALVTSSFRPRNDERRAVLRMLQSMPWVDTQPFGYKSLSTPTHEAWLRQQATYKYAISPPGNGLDCHRTWEMILIGVVPVMKTSIIDSVYEHLRETGAVLILNAWDEFNQTRLDSHWSQFGAGLMKRRDWLEDADNGMLVTHWIEKFVTVYDEHLLSRTPQAMDYGEVSS